MAPAPKKTGLAVGRGRGHITTPRAYKKEKFDRSKLAEKEGLTKKTLVKSIIQEVAGYAPYERRIMELIKNSKDKRAKKLTKRKLGTIGRAKRKIEELTNAIAESRRH